MKRKIKTSPGQITIFDNIIYANNYYNNLKEAMISAMQDFYIRKKYPSKIITINNIYNLKAMKRFWQLHGLLDQCIY